VLSIKKLAKSKRIFEKTLDFYFFMCYSKDKRGGGVWINK